jgi:hypothetical protein
MKIILYVLAGLVGLFIGLLVNKKSSQNETKKIDEALINEEKKLRESIVALRQQEIETTHRIMSHQRQEREYKENLARRREEDNQILEEYRKEKLALIDQQIKSEFALSREKLKQNIAEITQLENNRLEESLQKNREEFVEKSKELHLQLENCKTDLEQYRLKRAAAIEDAKRQEEMKTQENFYKLQISETDLSDILELKTVEKNLSKKEVLNKLIYKVYFEKPYTDLAGRVVGKETKTGIYKITNTLNQKVYIGQAVNIAERWKQHIKRALGAEPLTQNKLYPAMAEDGVWNFTFEIVEVCEKAQLGEREQYWQKFFGAKEYGYSIK